MKLQAMNRSGVSAAILGETMKTVLKTTLLALILCVVGIPAVAQQQQWGQDNCLYTWNGRGWQQTRACRSFVQGDPNVFVLYDLADRGRRPILMIDMRYTGTQGWVYAYNFSPSFYLRYIYRGTWVPSAIPNDYNVLVNRAWTIVVPPPRFSQGAPTMSAEAQASQQQAAQLMTQLQFGKLLQGLAPNANSATPLPNCSLTSGNYCGQSSINPQH